VTEGYPLVMQLAGRRCLVVGGGTVASRKVVSLLRASADVTIVAPELDPEIERLTDIGGVRVERRPFDASDLDGAALAFAATNRRDVNRAVADAARARGIPVNVADDPSLCDFMVPAVVRQGEVTLAISTGGRSPAFARFLREQLEAWLADDRYALLELVAELRRELRESGADVDASAWQRALADEAVASAIAAGERGDARARLVAVLTAER
jgi:precorrin-2 dehydrogenase/sirohydrochlorin ferrochelatase